jgi:hypothetical protein
MRESRSIILFMLLVCKHATEVFDQMADEKPNVRGMAYRLQKIGFFSLREELLESILERDPRSLEITPEYYDKVIELAALICAIVEKIKRISSLYCEIAYKDEFYLAPETDGHGEFVLVKFPRESDLLKIMFLLVCKTQQVEDNIRALSGQPLYRPLLNVFAQEFCKVRHLLKNNTYPNSEYIGKGGFNAKCEPMGWMELIQRVDNICGTSFAALNTLSFYPSRWDNYFELPENWKSFLEEYAKKNSKKIRSAHWEMFPFNPYPQEESATFVVTTKELDEIREGKVPARIKSATKEKTAEEVTSEIMEEMGKTRQDGFEKITKTLDWMLAFDPKETILGGHSIRLVASIIGLYPYARHSIMLNE